MEPDIFDSKRIDPMLIKEEAEPFNSLDYIYELKLDGTRCLAYLDENKTDLRNKRYVYQTPIFPELKTIHEHVKGKCILDGELIVQGADGKPRFEEIQRRCLMSNTVKIELAAKKAPATFVAYDIIYKDDKMLIDLPLMERKRILQETVTENERIAVSRYIEEQGIRMFELTTKQELEGVVAKEKNSKYYFGKRTKDWIKIKNMCDDDYVIAGYLFKERGKTLVLGQYNQNGELVYKSHVTGLSQDTFNHITAVPKTACPFKDALPESNSNAVWIEPVLVCKVEYMHKTKHGGLRQPVFRGLRDDKSAKKCKEKST